MTGRFSELPRLIVMAPEYVALPVDVAVAPRVPPRVTPPPMLAVGIVSESDPERLPAESVTVPETEPVTPRIVTDALVAVKLQLLASVKESVVATASELAETDTDQVQSGFWVAPESAKPPRLAGREVTEHVWG